MTVEFQKQNGAYYTPKDVAATLVNWAVRNDTDRMLDPACGDGRFIALHRNVSGVEQQDKAYNVAKLRAPWAAIHCGDFFAWATHTTERFDAVVGNPPFIRYQRFCGNVRDTAQSLCTSLGVRFSSLSSSWAPFLVGAASLLRPGGRMAFVVPAEIGHAPYAIPLLEYLANNFSKVHIVAVQERIFEELSEDCWLLYVEGFGGSTQRFRFSAIPGSLAFSPKPPTHGTDVSILEWKRWNCRLRPFLLPADTREFYRRMADSKTLARLGDIAKVGIGYVTGANDFFHIKPSVAAKLGFPKNLLRLAVRNGRMLSGDAITQATVRKWIDLDEACLLLRIEANQSVPVEVQAYLNSDNGREARKTYKCRMRDPWYAVPDVTVPDAFLSYMSGATVSLVANQAGCVCTNSVHAVRLQGKFPIAELQRRWARPLTRLSCEIEGHPLGGGMLKVEPREASRILLPERGETNGDNRAVIAGIEQMQKWRHYG